MIRDQFIDKYINSLEKEMDSLRHGAIESQGITLEELRRTQGIYSGMVKSLDILKGLLESEDT